MSKTLTALISDRCGGNFESTRIVISALEQWIETTPPEQWQGMVTSLAYGNSQVISAGNKWVDLLKFFTEYICSHYPPDKLDADVRLTVANQSLAAHMDDANLVGLLDALGMGTIPTQERDHD